MFHMFHFIWWKMKKYKMKHNFKLKFSLFLSSLKRVNEDFCFTKQDSIENIDNDVNDRMENAIHNK